MTSIKTRIDECHCKVPSSDLLPLCLYPVCYDHVDPVSVCDHCIFFWKDTRWECDLRNLQGMGCSLVPLDIYLPKTLVQGPAQQVKALHFCDQSPIFAGCRPSSSSVSSARPSA